MSHPRDRQAAERERMDMMDDFMREESQWNPFVRSFFDPEERQRQR